MNGNNLNNLKQQWVGCFKLSKLFPNHLPQGWEVSRIDTICRLSSGSTPSRRDAGNFIGNILWVTSGELKQKFIKTTKEKISESAVRKCGLEMYESGTVVIAIYGLEAKGVRGTASIVGARCTISQACMAFTAFKDIDSEYFYYWYLLNGHAIGLRYAQGTKQQNLSAEIMGRFRICYPPIKEQRKIAKILAAQDKVIDLKERILEEKRRRKKYLMQVLLTGKKRLPGFSEEWNRHRLGQIGTRIKTRNTVGNDNVLTISAQHGLISQTDFFNNEVAGGDKSGYYLLQKDDFAYNRSYSAGYSLGAIKRMTQDEQGIVSPLYICFKITDMGVSLEYLSQYFDAGMMNSELQAVAQEGARNHGLLNISVEDFFNITLALPAHGEQKKIAGILIAADKEIYLLERGLSEERRKKKALMQLLLTGRMRV